MRSTLLQKNHLECSVIYVKLLLIILQILTEKTDISTMFHRFLVKTRLAYIRYQ